jgi:hypothetical protein
LTRRAIPSKTLDGIGSFVDEIPRLCRKYFLLCHRRNPIVDLDNLDR